MNIFGKKQTYYLMKMFRFGTNNISILLIMDNSKSGKNKSTTEYASDVLDGKIHKIYMLDKFYDRVEGDNFKMHQSYMIDSSDNLEELKDYAMVNLL